MSENLDEETKRILAEVNANEKTLDGSDDSKSNHKKDDKFKHIYKNANGDEYEVSEDKEMDDSDW